jgi:4-amino-4-deoxy-L-arabinose transferase-like glycosyltransferase
MISSMRLSKLDISVKAFLLALLFTFLFFVPRLNTFSAPFERDEGEYAYSAWILRQGIYPYENSFMQKPPLIIYTYAFGQIFDQGVVSPRILSTLFVLATSILLALVAKKEFGGNSGWMALFLSVPLFTIPFNTPYAANTENFMILPLTVLLCVYLRKKNKASFQDFLLSGVFAALTLLYKPIGIPIVLLIYIVWLWEVYKKDNLKEVMIKSACAFVGALITTLVMLVPFIISGKMSYLFESSVVYNFSYTGFEGFKFSNIFNYIGGRYIKYYWLLYILLIYYLIKRPVRWRFYLGLFVAALLSVYSSPMGHYYILVIPFWILISTHALTTLVREKILQNRMGKWGGLFVTMAIVVLFIYPFRMQIGLPPEQQSIWMYGSINPFVDAYHVGNYLQQNTDIKDYIFVAGSEPEIYYYAKRMSPTRFVITYPLNITSGYREKYQTETVNALRNNQPEVIVVSNLTHSGLWNEGSPTILINYLNELIKDNYRTEGLYIWVRNKGYLLTDFGNDEMAKASLIIYRKK